MTPISGLYVQGPLEPLSTSELDTPLRRTLIDASRLERSSRSWPQLILARALDAHLGWEDNTSLSRFLSVGGATLSGSLELLPLYQRSQLAKRIETGTLQGLISLSQEPDPELFARGLERLSQQLQSQGEVALASALLASARQAAETDPAWRRGTTTETLAVLGRDLEVLQGGGNFGARTEFTLRHVVREAAHPAVLLSFGMAQAFFQGVRLAALARLTASPTTGFFTRGFGAQTLAGAFGVIAEAPVLTLSGRSLRQALGEEQNWSSSSLGADCLANGITLGLLRTSGVLSQHAFESLHGISPYSLLPTRFTELAGFSRGLFPQVGMWGAILLSFQVEDGLGLRSRADASRLFTDSLLTLFQFNVGARLFEAFQPRGFAEWARGLELRARSLAENRRSPGRNGPLTILPALAFATGLSPQALRPIRGLEGLVMMAERPKDLAGEPDEMGARSVSTVSRHIVNFRSLFEDAPHPLLVASSQGEILYANGEARRMFLPMPLGIEMLPRKFGDLFQLLEGEEGIFVSTPSDAEPRFWQIATRPLESDEPLVAYFLTDITEQRQLRLQATALHEQNARLQSKTQLEESVLHDAAHALHDVSLSEELLEKVVKTDVPGDTANDETPSSRFANVTSRLSELKTAIGSTMKLFTYARRLFTDSNQVKVLSLSTLLEEAINLNAGARRQGKINLVPDFGVEELSLVGEEGSILSAVINLLVNACHAMPDGGEIRLRSYPQGSNVVIEVSDTGTGISPKDLPHIFDLHFTTKEHTGGTGLGLANVKWAVEKVHGGRVDVESTLGQGSTFRLTLPTMGRSKRRSQ